MILNVWQQYRILVAVRVLGVSALSSLNNVIWLTTFSGSLHQGSGLRIHCCIHGYLHGVLFHMPRFMLYFKGSWTRKERKNKTKSLLERAFHSSIHYNTVASKNEAFCDILTMRPMEYIICFIRNDCHFVVRGMKLWAVVFLCDSLVTLQTWQTEELPIHSVTQHAS